MSDFENSHDKGWVGFDLDGTMAVNPGGGIETIGEPVPAIIDLIRKYRDDGFEVRIVTARVAPYNPRDFGPAYGPKEIAEQVRMIESWCESYVGFSMPITCQKDFRMRYLYDDRARQVEADTGRLMAEVYDVQDLVDRISRAELVLVRSGLILARSLSKADMEDFAAEQRRIAFRVSKDEAVQAAQKQAHPNLVSRIETLTRELAVARERQSAAELAIGSRKASAGISQENARELDRMRQALICAEDLALYERGLGDGTQEEWEVFIALLRKRYSDILDKASAKRFAIPLRERAEFLRNSVLHPEAT